MSILFRKMFFAQVGNNLTDISLLDILCFFMKQLIIKHGSALLKT